MSKDHLENLLTEMQQINREAEQLVTGLSEQQLNWVPEPGAWSIAQCLDHLAVTSAKTRPYLEVAIARGKQRTARPYRPTMLGRWIINSQKPESTKRFKAPKNFQPLPEPAPGAFVRFLEEQRQLASLAERASGADLNVKMRSPVTALIRYSAGDAFQLLTVHAQRHLRQARRVKERQGFPQVAN